MSFCLIKNIKRLVAIFYPKRSRILLAMLSEEEQPRRLRFPLPVQQIQETQ